MSAAIADMSLSQFLAASRQVGLPAWQVLRDGVPVTVPEPDYLDDRYTITDAGLAALEGTLTAV